MFFLSMSFFFENCKRYWVSFYLKIWAKILQILKFEVKLTTLDTDHQTCYFISLIHTHITLIKCRRKQLQCYNQNLCQTEYFRESLKFFCSFTVKWQPFQFLAKFVKNAFYSVDIFQLCKHQVFFFIAVRNMHKRQLSSTKFMLCKH